jgi:hypothetical protein
MKNFILTLAIVGAAFFGMTTLVKAGNYHNYWVTVITYKDHYSNNGYRDWKRSISSQKHFFNQGDVFAIGGTGGRVCTSQLGHLLFW